MQANAAGQNVAKAVEDGFYRRLLDQRGGHIEQCPIPALGEFERCAGFFLHGQPEYHCQSLPGHIRGRFEVWAGRIHGCCGSEKRHEHESFSCKRRARSSSVHFDSRMQ